MDQNHYLFKHGLCLTPEYRAWIEMKRRCFSKYRKGYENYGGRGITVCGRWLDSFENFLYDMGTKPGIKYTLERNDNDGNYEPDNCSWETYSTQRRNTRVTKLTPMAARVIRRLREFGMEAKDIRNFYDVSHTVIYLIGRGIIWQEMKEKSLNDILRNIMKTGHC